jgi:hypothetical protein
MRVYLAAQVVSQSMCRLIDDHAVDPKLYSALRKVLVCVDKIVDIFNGTQHNSKGEAKYCENIDRPSHPLLQELLEHLALFAEWKKEAGKNTNSFLPQSTYEDLCWMIFGLVGLSQNYLKADKSRVLVQRRLSTDNVEHTFGHVRANNPEFSVFEANRYAATGMGQRLNASFLGRKTNNAKANTTHKMSDIHRLLYRN